jgi:hypothetical protein
MILAQLLGTPKFVFKLIRLKTEANDLRLEPSEANMKLTGVHSATCQRHEKISILFNNLLVAHILPKLLIVRRILHFLVITGGGRIFFLWGWGGGGLVIYFCFLLTCLDKGRERKR